MTEPTSDLGPAASTGIAGLDDVLGGGFARHRLFLVEGAPGAGKTTLALQFLRQGAAHGEGVLYVTLSETEEELHAVVQSHGWSLDGITLLELSPTEDELEPDQQHTMFHPADTDLASTTARVLREVDARKPSRVVIDSLSELRLLAGHPLRYRRQVLALKQFFARRGCTVLLLDDLTAGEHDLQMRSIAHGVLLLDQVQPGYGAQRRRLQVLKYRGTQFRGGFHDYVIARGGLRVFPRLVASEHRRVSEGGRMASGVAGLDQLLGGGLVQGTSTLLVGAAGTGKSTIAAQLVASAAARGERGAMFLFEERPQTLLTRCSGAGIPLAAAVDQALVAIQPVGPAEFTPGELVDAIRQAVEGGVRLVVLDSLNGYLNAMPDERFFAIQLHELLMYLGQQGVATLLVGAHQGLIGPQLTTAVDASYLADTVILMRYFEAQGELRQAVSVVKNRGGLHERSIRELRIAADGLRVGEPLRHFHGVFTGVPTGEEPPRS
jgi:circadian clock protein KaiC